jgi:hypothetical protein
MTGFTVDGSGNVAGNSLKIAPTGGTYTIPASPTFQTVPLAGGLLAGVTGSYNNNTGNAAIFTNYIGNFNVTRVAAGYVENTRIVTGVGGASQTGGFINLDSVLLVNVPTADTVNSFYEAGNFVSNGSVNVGGTSTSVTGGAAGTVNGADVYATLSSGATDWLQILGQEIDLSGRTGSSFAQMAGLQIVLLNDNAVSASTESTAIIIAAQLGATPTLTSGLQFGGYSGRNAMASTAGLIKVVGHAGGTSYPQITVTDGMDLHLAAFTGKFLRGSNDTFTVDGSGNILGNNLQLTGTPTLATSSTGAGTQTFTNSPCSGLTTERWVPIAITGQTGTWYIAACQ